MWAQVRAAGTSKSAFFYCPAPEHFRIIWKDPTVGCGAQDLFRFYRALISCGPLKDAEKCFSAWTAVPINLIIRSPVSFWLILCFIYVIVSPASGGRWTRHKQSSGEHYLIRYLISCSVEKGGSWRTPWGFSRRITGKDSIPGCSDLIRVRFVVLDCKARIPLLMPLVTCAKVLSGRAFFFSLKGRKIWLDSGIQILTIVCSLDVLGMWALRQHIRSQS